MNSVPDFLEPITAYRAWAVDLTTGQLISLNRNVWPDGTPLHAVCIRGGFRHHPAPQFYCSCGIYAVKRIVDRDNVFPVWRGAPLVENDCTCCFGTVSLWGRVIEHENGFRAEFAYPAELFCLDAKVARIIEQRYEVPVRVWKLGRPPFQVLAVGGQFWRGANLPLLRTVGPPTRPTPPWHRIICDLDTD